MKKPGHWFVYMLECENGSYYTGSTDDVARRFDEHVRGTAGAKYTRSFRPVRIARCWRVAGSRGEAQRVERAIQKLDRRGKLALVSDPGLLGGILPEGAAASLEAVAPGTGRLPAEERDITRYRPAAGDTDGNPYLEEILALVKARRRSGRDVLARELAGVRGEFIARYAFSIPTPDIVREIARHSPLVEIGAGSGYWAMCLKSAGADIICYDSRPPSEEAPWDASGGNRWFEDEWCTVIEGDASMAGRYPERTLFLCWPPIHDPMAHDALRGYGAAGGKKIVYVGDPGASGDEAFHRELSALEMETSIRLWAWPGIDERLMIYSI